MIYEKMKLWDSVWSDTLSNAVMFFSLLMYSSRCCNPERFRKDTESLTIGTSAYNRSRIASSTFVIELQSEKQREQIQYQQWLLSDTRYDQGTVIIKTTLPHTIVYAYCLTVGHDSSFAT